MRYEKVDFNGGKYTDKINARSGVPNTTVDLETYKVGVALEREFSSNRGDFLLGGTLYYANTELDMSTGWFISTPANMKAEDNFGVSIYCAPKAFAINPKLTLAVGDILSLGCSLSNKF